MQSRASAVIRSKKYGGLHILQGRRFFFGALRALSAVRNDARCIFY
jgi:hypothetical protein